MDRCLRVYLLLAQQLYFVQSCVKVIQAMIPVLPINFSGNNNNSSTVKTRYVTNNRLHGFIVYSYWSYMMNRNAYTTPPLGKPTPIYWGGLLHDDVIEWKHFPRYWPFVRGIHRSPVNSPHKGQWRGALMFSLICVWIMRLVIWDAILVIMTSL